MYEFGYLGDDIVREQNYIKFTPCGKCGNEITKFKNRGDITTCYSCGNTQTVEVIGVLDI